MERLPNYDAWKLACPDEDKPEVEREYDPEAEADSPHIDAERIVAALGRDGHV